MKKWEFNPATFGVISKTLKEGVDYEMDIFGFNGIFGYEAGICRRMPADGRCEGL
jgi:hypothetical protein